MQVKNFIIYILRTVSCYCTNITIFQHFFLSMFTRTIPFCFQTFSSYEHSYNAKITCWQTPQREENILPKCPL